MFFAKIWKHQNLALREKCPYSEFFWSVFSCICTEYGEILSMSPYSARLRENTNQKNSKYGHFSHSVENLDSIFQKKKKKKMKKRNAQRHTQNPVEHLRWNFLRK